MKAFIRFALMFCCCIALCVACNKRLKNKQTTDNPTVQLDSLCLLQPDPGLCKAAFTKYYYDREAQDCKSFVWGGCDGTVPFHTLEVCRNTCPCKPSTSDK